MSKQIMSITGLILIPAIPFKGIMGKEMIFICYFTLLDLADLLGIKSGIINLNIVRFPLEFIPGRYI